MQVDAFTLTNVSTEVGRIEGSLSDQILYFNRPVLPPGSGYFYDLLRTDQGDPIDTQILITNPACNGSEGMYARPVSFRLLLESRLLGSLQNNFLRIWLPTPPEGFAVLGLCVSTTDVPPHNFYCIRSEFAVQPSEEDVNSFSFLIVRSPVAENFSIIRSRYLSFSVNSYLPVLHPSCILSLQRQTIIKEFPRVSGLFGYITKPKSKRVDPADDRHVLRRLTLFKPPSSSGVKSSRSIPTSKTGTLRSFRVSNSSIAKGTINASRFSRSGIGSKFAEELLSIDEDQVVIYLTQPAKGPRFGECISTKHIVVPHASVGNLLAQATQVLDLSKRPESIMAEANAAENADDDATVLAAITTATATVDLMPPGVTPELVHEIFAPCVGFKLAGVMPSSFAPPKKDESRTSKNDLTPSLSYTSGTNTPPDAYTMDENGVLIPRPSKELQEVKYTYLYEPIAPPGYTAISVVLGDDNGEPPEKKSVLTINSQYIAYTDVYSAIGELYDAQSAEYCYKYLKLQQQLLNARRKEITSPMPSSEKFARPVLSEVPLPPSSYFGAKPTASRAVEDNIDSDIENTAPQQKPGSPLRNFEHANNTSGIFTLPHTCASTAFAEEGGKIIPDNGHLQGGSTSATLSELDEELSLDKLVRPAPRAVKLVTPRGSPFILIHDQGPGSEEKPDDVKFPILAPSLLNFIFFEISTSLKELLGSISLEQTTVKVASLLLPPHTLQFFESTLRKPSYACLGAILRWSKIESTEPQAPPPAQEQQPVTRGTSNQRPASGKKQVKPAEPQQPIPATATIPLPPTLPELMHLSGDLTVTAKSSAFDVSIFAEPEALLPVWSSSDLWSSDSVTIYRMVPPPGYVALGYVVSPAEQQPRKSKYCCISASFVTRAAAQLHKDVLLPRVTGYPALRPIMRLLPFMSDHVPNSSSSLGFLNICKDGEEQTPIVWIFKDQIARSIMTLYLSTYVKGSMPDGDPAPASLMPPNSHPICLSIDAFPALENTLSTQVVSNTALDLAGTRNTPLASILQEITTIKGKAILKPSNATIANMTSNTSNPAPAAEAPAVGSKKDKAPSRGSREGSSKSGRATSAKKTASSIQAQASTTEPPEQEVEQAQENSAKQCLVTVTDADVFTFGTRYVSTSADFILSVRNNLPESVDMTTTGTFARPAAIRVLTTNVTVGETPCYIFKVVPPTGFAALGDVIISERYLQSLNRAESVASSALSAPPGDRPPKGQSSVKAATQEPERLIDNTQTIVALAEAALLKQFICIHRSFTETVTLKTVSPGVENRANLVPIAGMYSSSKRANLSAVSKPGESLKSGSAQVGMSSRTSMHRADSIMEAPANASPAVNTGTTRPDPADNSPSQKLLSAGISQEVVESVRVNNGRFTPSRAASRKTPQMGKFPGFLDLHESISLPSVEGLTVAPPRPMTRGNNTLILQHAEDFRSCFNIGHIEEYAPPPFSQINDGCVAACDLYPDCINCENPPGYPMSTGVMTLLVDGYKDKGNGYWVYTDGVHVFSTTCPQKEVRLERLKAAYLNPLLLRLYVAKEEELEVLKGKEHESFIKTQSDQAALIRYGSKASLLGKRRTSESAQSSVAQSPVDIPYDGIYYWTDPLPAHSLCSASLLHDGKAMKGSALEVDANEFDSLIARDFPAGDAAPAPAPISMLSLLSLHIVSCEQILTPGLLFSACPAAQLDTTKKSRRDDAKKAQQQAGATLQKNLAISMPKSRFPKENEEHPAVNIADTLPRYKGAAHLLRALIDICDILLVAEQYKVVGRNPLLSFKTPRGYVVISDKVPVSVSGTAAQPSFLSLAGEMEAVPAWVLILEKVLAYCAGSYSNLYNKAPIELVLFVMGVMGFEACNSRSGRPVIRIYYTATDASLVNFAEECAEVTLASIAAG